MESLTLSDMQGFYSTYIDPSSTQRAKLSIHMHAQAKPKASEGAGVSDKFSVEASNAFLVDLKAAQIPVDEPQYIALSKAEPPLQAVLQFWTMHLDKVPFINKAKKEQLLARARELASKHPVSASTAEGVTTNGGLKEGTIIIEDLAKFKKGLQLSKPAVPLMSLEVEEVPVDNVGPKL